MADRKLKIDVVGDEAGAVRKLNTVEREIKGVGTAADRGGSAITSMIGTFAGFVSAQAVIAGVSRAFRFASEAAFGMNATLETATLQFGTLMGSAERAKIHVEGLFEFAKKTPFETGPIIEASRLLQTFGGDALNTTANLLLIGDAAAGTGAPIEALGMWTGRLVANLEAGKPFGEAAARLGELAVLSPQARSAMEDLAKAGGSADDIFALFKTDLEKFTGSMEKQAGTWDGVTSTFTDTVNILVGEAFKPLFEAARDSLAAFNDLLGSDGVAAGVTEFAAILQKHLPTAAELFGFLNSAILGTLTVFDAVQTGFNLFQSGIGRIAAFVSGAIAGMLEVNLLAIDAFERILPGSILQSSGAYAELVRSIAAARGAQEAWTASADAHVSQLVTNSETVERLREVVTGLGTAKATAAAATDVATASAQSFAAAQEAIVGVAPAVVASVNEMTWAMASYAAGAGSAARASGAVSSVGDRFSGPNVGTGGSGSGGPQRFERDREDSVAATVGSNAIPQLFPTGGWVRVPGSTWNRIPSPQPRHGSVTVTVNAQGAVFEDDRSLNRLADKLAGVMVTRGRLGGLSGAMG